MNIETVEETVVVKVILELDREEAIALEALMNSGISIGVLQDIGLRELSRALMDKVGKYRLFGRADLLLRDEAIGKVTVVKSDW